ncbi:SLC8A1 [Symbiodinium natans]|uniref:SLC8A1 protein n=1 Tax=Symbiodinium natans TaxID=878477 RepID=A0A812LHM9_9DINO|nr:SLC8A1 [Symbiodinium natans]
MEAPQNLGSVQLKQQPRNGRNSVMRMLCDAYDEQLQEDVFLGKLEIKNTFYNIPVSSSMTEGPAAPDSNWKSAPADLVQRTWRTKFPEMEAAHNRGECKPCAYFLYKPDGCRNSENCPYCHLCRKGEIKRRKRQRAKQFKAAAALEAGQVDGHQDCSD